MTRLFKGDYRIVRVVLASNNPIETMAAINSGRYSIITLLDTLEMLDIQDTFKEESRFQDNLARSEQERRRK